jgi:hypothetical protein
LTTVRSQGFTSLMGFIRAHLTAVGAPKQHWPMSGSRFQVGDRGFVTGGYGADPAWLQVGVAYRGRLVEILGGGAVVELDDSLTLSGDAGRLHVGLCDFLPNLRDIPRGGGAGVWVESHAMMTHER